MKKNFNRVIFIPVIMLLIFSLTFAPVVARTTVERISTRGAYGLWEENIGGEDVDIVVEVLDESEIGVISFNLDFLFDEDPSYFDDILVPSEFRWSLGACSVSTEIFVADEAEDFTLSIMVEWDTDPPTLRDKVVEEINGEKVISTSISREGVATITIIVTWELSPSDVYNFSGGSGIVWETTSLTISG